MLAGNRIWFITVAVAVLFGATLAVYWRTIPRARVATPTALEKVQVQIVRCELGARETEAVVKVHVRLRNAAAVPVRIGPGSFWLVDMEGMPYLDRHAAENPDKPPLKLAPGHTGPEMELKFTVAPNILSRSLVLLIGEPPEGKAGGSPPPNPAIRVLLKENGAPKGPFVEGEWKTYVGTRWR